MAIDFNFNPLPPYGGRLCQRTLYAFRLCISIHSLRMEGDTVIAFYFGTQTENFNPLPPYGGRLGCKNLESVTLPFQSTPSVWRETAIDSNVSIGHRNFNPLPPYGGRRTEVFLNEEEDLFQSTPSVWRETFQLDGDGNEYGISIHSLRMEGDLLNSNRTMYLQTFQSTPSVWRETSGDGMQIIVACISIHSLRMEGDIIFERVRKWERHFNPLPPYGGRLQRLGKSPEPKIFQSTPSVWRETGF